MSQEKKLLLIDGHSLAYRAYHALPIEKFTSPQGIPVNAVYGLCSMLINLLTEIKPTHLAVCFDESRDTFRKKMYDPYKATRSKTPDEFKVQTSLVRGLIDSLGIMSFSHADYEADDLIATLTKMAQQKELATFIVTSDRDQFQLISDKTTVLYPKKGLSDLIYMTPIAIMDKYNLTPDQYLDFAALRGDPADNLPGIPGVGEKTAIAWVQKYGSLENLIALQGELPGKVGESFRNNRNVVELNKVLSTLVNNIDLKIDIENLEWQPAKAGQALAFCSDLGFKSLLPRIRLMIGKESSERNISKIKSNQINVISIDDENIYFLTSGNFQSFRYKNLDEYHQKLHEAISLGDCSVADVKQIAKKSIALGGRLPMQIASKMQDVLILQYLINPGSRPQLEDLFDGSSAQDLFSEVRDQEKILQGISNLASEISQNANFSQVLKLYLELELPVALVLAEMEFHGIAISLKELLDSISQKKSEIEKLEQSGFDLVGRQFNFASPKQLQEILFDHRGLTKTKKTKTGFTTDSDALEFLILKHPDDQLLPIIQQWRESAKVKQMLVSLQEAVSGDRIHTTFMQTVAATGRLSSIKPNLQNVPTRTEAGKSIRNLFCSNLPYGFLITADYSQIELRVMAHLADDKALIAAFKSGEDLHVSVASEIFGIEKSAVTADLRNQIKAVSYGLAYGLSAYGLSQSLRIEVSDADNLMKKFFERFDGVRNYLNNVVDQARSDGYTETILGRRRYLPDLNDDNRLRREAAERMALNAPIQGSAADIIKMAMINVNHALNAAELQCRLLLQVHDELVLECSEHDLAESQVLVKKIMSEVFELNVPLETSIGVGKTWLTAAH